MLKEQKILFGDHLQEWVSDFENKILMNLNNKLENQICLNEQKNE